MKKWFFYHTCVRGPKISSFLFSGRIVLKLELIRVVTDFAITMGTVIETETVFVDKAGKVVFVQSQFVTHSAWTVELVVLQMFAIVQQDSRGVVVKGESVKNHVKTKANVSRKIHVSVGVVIMELIVSLVNVLFHV